MFLVNLAQDSSKHSPYISSTLLQKIETSLQNNKKVILYLNKRAAYSSLICEHCSHIFECPNCDVSLHVHENHLQCHICNTTCSIPKNCPACSTKNIKKVGVGTKQIEQIMKHIFPNNTIFRFDADQVKNKTEKKQALETLKNAEIIIGTKMITTGFDFKNVGVVGVILLEQELQAAKYNTEETVYSNITQLLGRGNRKGETTEIIIQTFVPENQVVTNITDSNYKDFFIETLKERKLFSYPPFSEYAVLEYRHKDQEKAKNYIQKLFTKLEQEQNENISLFCSYKSFKKYNQFYFNIIIKGDNIRDFLQCIKADIFKNSQLSIIFES